jgi:glucosamine-phosphate N-acetyltransferase
MATEIRALTREDMPEVIQLLKESMSSFAPLEQDYDEIWRDFSCQNNVNSVVLRKDGVAIGFGSLVIEQKIRGGALAHIEDICVAARVQREGYGGLIVKHLIEIAKNLSCYKVILNCEDRSVDFYNSIGFQVDGVSMSHLIGT